MRHRNRAILFLSLFLFFLCATAALAQEAKQPAFLGNKNSKKYHVASCQWAQKIAPKNRVELAAVKEAEEKGYVACKVCKPNEKKP